MKYIQVIYILCPHIVINADWCGVQYSAIPVNEILVFISMIRNEMPQKLAVGRENFELNQFEAIFSRHFISDHTDKNENFIDWDGTELDTTPICIDDYMRAKDLEHLDILHADIQGAETDMLNGATEALAGHRITYLFISTHGDKHGPCLEILRKKDYRIIASHTMNESASVDGLIVAAGKNAPIQEEIPINRL